MINTRKIRKIAGYFTLNAIFGYSLYAGIFLGSGGFANVALFMAWTLAVISIPLLFRGFLDKNELKKMMDGADYTTSQFFDVAFDVAIIAVMAYGGWFITAGAYVFHVLVFNDFRREVNVYNKEKYAKNA